MMISDNYDIRDLLKFFEYWKKYTHPTEFYNEGWLLKILVFAVTDFGLKDHILYVDESDEFFSEALLYSPFLSQKGQKSFAESHTHADGVIGNFTIGDEENKGSLNLTGNKLNVFEAKINAKFSKKVTNAPFYDQVSRYIACIAETVGKGGRIETLDDLIIGFYLTIPKEKYDKDKSFEKCLNRENIFEKVKKRVDQYKNENDYQKRQIWLNNIFTPVLKKITIEPIFYETIIEELKGYKYIDEINGFYKKCIECNK